jgi:DNA-binding LytR/AlgR family response regulator
MKIAIIEDETLTAGDLADTILEIDDTVEIIASLQSVREAVDYFKNNKAPDLIFSDIQLSDGLCFEIFKELSLTVPVIFCTAYDEYAIRAFRANGIDYIVKPFTGETVSAALERYRSLKQNFSGDSGSVTHEALMELLERKKGRDPASLLVHYQDQIVPVKIKDIALFYIENEMTRLLTLNRDHFFVDKNLEELEELAGENFFRANRQHLLNRDAVKSASRYFGRKLAISLYVPYEKNIIVSKAKATAFLDWLSL